MTQWYCLTRVGYVSPARNSSRVFSPVRERALSPVRKKVLSPIRKKALSPSGKPS